MSELRTEKDRSLDATNLRASYSRPRIGVNVFPSKGIGNAIIYADSGMKTTHTVGSIDEDMYFKVAYVSQRLPAVLLGTSAAASAASEGLPVYRNSPTQTLFYDGPRDYAVHYLTVLSQPSRALRRLYDQEDYLQQEVERMLSSMSSIVLQWEKKQSEVAERVRREKEETEWRAAMADSVVYATVVR